MLSYNSCNDVERGHVGRTPAACALHARALHTPARAPANAARSSRAMLVRVRTAHTRQQHAWLFSVFQGRDRARG